MIFGYFTLAVALIISAVAAYYSIVGLMTIFAAAIIPIIIMGAALEVGKVTAAVWLKLNWHRAALSYKLYLVPAVAFLMLLTSMGIFGFLSKAHSDQSLVSGDVQSRIAIYDEKIKIAKENIDANRAALRQLDAAVDQVMGRSTTEQGAERSVQIRRQQGPERQRLLREIEAEQKKISALNEERAPIAAEVRKVEAEVGPIKYIAALIYGDTADNNLLESAVRWVIILIVVVFDPLALVLILAAQQSIRWAREEKVEDHPPYYVADVSEPPTKEEKEEFRKELENDPEVNEFFKRGREIAQALDRGDPIPGAKVIEESLQDEQGDDSAKNDNYVDKDPMAPPAESEHRPETHPYLRKGFVYPDGWQHQPPVVAGHSLLPTVSNIESVKTQLVEQPPIVPPVVLDIVREAAEPPPKLKIVVPEAFDPKIAKAAAATGLAADNDRTTDKEIKAHFGISFPDNPDKGEMYLRVDFLPSRLYKFNGSVWIEVDKTLTDSYVYNTEYIEFLISEIEQGKIDPEELSVSEREQVTEFLDKNESTGNAT